MKKNNGLEITIAAIAGYARRQIADHADWLEKMGEDVEKLRDLVSQSDEEILWWLGRQTDLYCHLYEFRGGQMEDLAAGAKDDIINLLEKSITIDSVESYPPEIVNKFSVGDWVMFSDPLYGIDEVGEIVRVDHYGRFEVKTSSENCYGIKPESCTRTSPPLDKNGELIDVGDLVMQKWAGVSQIIELKPRGMATARSLVNGYSFCIEEFPAENTKKLTSLTAEQYLPLARRTLSPELQGDDEPSTLARRMYLAIGLLGEWYEFSKNPNEEEAGDVIWYLEQFLAEYDNRRSDWAYVATIWGESFILSEMIKKAVVHKREEYIDQLLAFCWHIIGHEKLTQFNWNKVRYQNIKKLLDRYPEGFEAGGGNR